jgi:hypothetical protein
MILKDTHVVERQWFKHVPLTKPIDTTNEQHVDDVIVGVKHVYLGDWFWFSKGGNVNPIFKYLYTNWLLPIGNQWSNMIWDLVKLLLDNKMLVNQFVEINTNRC